MLVEHVLSPFSHSAFFCALPHTRVERTAWQVGGVEAIAQWQRGVVAIGLRRDPLSESVLIGTGFIVDMAAGIISTCAHVVLDAFYHNEGPLDPGISGANGGVAIGVGIGERVQWICRADLRCISQPPASYAQNLCSRCRQPQGPQVAPQQRRGRRQCLNPNCLHPADQQKQFLKGPPPSHWPVQDSADLAALDLALLQLADVSGQPLSEQTEPMTGEPLLTLWPRCLIYGWSPDLDVEAADHPRGLPIPAEVAAPLLADLACALRLGHASTLQDGEPFVMLGYGQSGTGSGADRTSTTTRGHFSGSYASSSTGVWYKTTVTILPGHSGGPVLNRRGEVIGWAVMSDRSLGQLRPVERLLEAVVHVLNAVVPGRAGGPVTWSTVRDRLLGHIPESERLDLGDGNTWDAAMRVLHEASDAAAQAQVSAEQADDAALDAEQSAQDAAWSETAAAYSAAHAVRAAQGAAVAEQGAQHAAGRAEQSAEGAGSSAMAAAGSAAHAVGAASDASASASAASALGYAGALQAQVTYQVQMGIAAAQHYHQLLSNGVALPPLGASMSPLLHQLPPPAASSETSPVQDHGRGARSVITLCIEGDVTAFDARRLSKLREALASELADEMAPEHVEIKPLRATPRIQAKIGTGRCRIKVEVDQNGFAKFDSSSSESSDADSQQSDEDRLERQVERNVEYVIRSRHWPTTIEVGDIEVFCILPGSVLLVLLLPTVAAHVLFQLCQQGVAALTAEGVRCCKLRGQVARCDAALGAQEHDAQSMHVAALCEAEQAAAASLPVLPPTS